MVPSGSMTQPDDSMAQPDDSTTQPSGSMAQPDGYIPKPSPCREDLAVINTIPKQKKESAIQSQTLLAISIMLGLLY